MMRSTCSPLRRSMSVAMLLAAIFATGTFAQEPADESALPPDVAEAVRPVVSDAEARGLPVAPILDKAREGAAKGVPADRIRAVVERLSGRLDHARTLLADAARAAATAPSPPADVAAVADALTRGVPESAVSRMRADAPPDQPIALAVHTLADLVQRDVPVDAALNVLEAWSRRGDAPGELHELPAAVERLIRQGVLPDQAAAAITSAIRSGRPPGAVGRPPNAGPPSGVGSGPPVQPPIPPGAGPPAHAPGGPGSGG